MDSLPLATSQHQDSHPHIHQRRLDHDNTAGANDRDQHHSKGLPGLRATTTMLASGGIGGGIGGDRSATPVPGDMAARDALRAIQASTNSNATSPMRCCCGIDECNFLKHNYSVLDSVEKDVHVAARMGQVCRQFFPGKPRSHCLHHVEEGFSCPCLTTPSTAAHSVSHSSS